MDAITEQTLHNLHVLAALSHNDKLMTNELTFTIYVPTSWRAMARLWQGEGRAANVTKVRQTFRTGMSFVTKSLEDANVLLATLTTHEVPEMMRFRARTIAVQHWRMSEALAKACNGIDNLRQTYRDDAAFTSQIDLAVEEVRTFLAVMRSYTSNLMTRCEVSTDDGMRSTGPSPQLASHADLDGS